MTRNTLHNTNIPNPFAAPAPYHADCAEEAQLIRRQAALHQITLERIGAEELEEIESYVDEITTLSFRIKRAKKIPVPRGRRGFCYSHSDSTGCPRRVRSGEGRA